MNLEVKTSAPGVMVEMFAPVLQVIVDLTQERDYLSSQQPQDGRGPLRASPGPGHASADRGSAAAAPGLTKEEKQHLSVELADTRAKLRRYRQEL